MKTKYLLLGAIFAIFGLAAHAQVSEMYSQNFESGEPVNYSGSPATSVRYSTSIRSTGNRALKLVQSSTGSVEVILDTIDFTQNTTLRYIALRFDHICRVLPNSSTDFAMGMLYYKRANQPNWTPMTSQEYNISSGNYSSDFNLNGSFKDQSYSDWWHSNVPAVANNQWKSERFDIDNVMTSSVPANERKLLIKFVLNPRTSECTEALDTNNMAWWIDNITVSASAERMVMPKITMYEYPTIERYPNSRGARIELAATTTISTGINPDSVYLYYRGGSDPTEHKLSMTPMANRANHYECRIPFYGYDTLMRFYCVVRDATGNANKVTFPATAESNNTRVLYRCVRGNTEQPGLVTPGFTPTTTVSFFPFPSDADHRCEFVYDSALLREAGYGPGAITSLRFTLASSVNQARTDPRFQIKMKNVPGNYAVQMSENFRYYFTTEAMQIVYDSAFSIPTMPSNLDYTINLQDTFYYAGADILMQITYDGNVDRSSGVNIKAITAPTDHLSFYSWDGSASYGHNTFTSDYFVWTDPANSQNNRPAFIFTETHLQPLLYDAGISQLVSPNYDVPMTVRPGGLTVKLKNFGERTLNSVHISYSIDDTIFGSYVWTGALLGGDETNVLIANNINIPAGFHNLCVWTEDTVTSAGQQYRDHEPYNNNICSAFVVCDGPMSGVRNIGGSNPHFNDIEEFLFAVSRCGVDDSLIVRLAPGQYPSFTMPSVPGISQNNYIVFESRNNQSAAQRAVLFANNSSEQSSIVNVENTSNIRFRNLDFKRFDGPLTDMVLLGPNSANCRFEGCSFIDMLNNPVASLRINTMINSGDADNLTVDSCIFTGGNIGVNVRGAAPDDYSEGIIVRKSSFSNQYTSAVKLEYVDSVTVVDNEMMDVLSNTSYVILLNGCSGHVNVARNKVYTSHGAGAIALSDVTGTSAKHALLANNMLVSNDDGTANQLSSPLNVIQGEWIDVVYNSVKMTAPTRLNVAAASFGGGALNNSRFMNNIVASLDEVNYALSYNPIGSTSNSTSNNDYFSNGLVIIRRGSSSYTTLASWQSYMPNDTISVSVNPNFLNTTLVDLRTYNRNLKSVGRPVAAVATDIFGNVRGDSLTCPGAYEFSSLPYDFEPEALVSPLLETCNMPASVELVVLLRNSGINVHDSTSTNPLHLSYRVNSGPVHTITVNQSIPADDTVAVHTGQMLSLPSATYLDATYTIRVWNSSVDDPNPMNDTNVFSVLSRYHPAAPADIIDSIEYSTRDTITPSLGVNTWQVYGNAGAPRRPSTIFWYNDSTDTEPFYVGSTYITDELQQDAHYYIRQRRAMPIVRITQVELLRTATTVGLTSPMPYWIEGNRKAVVQLTNIGDATAYLEGDTLMTVSPTTSLNNKVYAFGNVKIEPGQSLVVQYANNGVTDSSLTVRTGLTPTFAYNSNVAFIYKRNGVVEDAIPFNAVITTPSNQPVSWANSNVPSYVWSGAGMTFPQNTAGVIRTSFNGGVGDWELSTASFPMFLGTTNEEWVMYHDYGCEGDMAQVTVGIIAPPPVDIDIATPVLPESGCGLGQENVTVTVSNFGGDTISNVMLHYCAGGDTVSETIVGNMLPHSDTVYTFITPLNLQFTTDSTLTVRVWTDSVDVDPIRYNDTNMATVTTLYTPGIPDTIADRIVHYAFSDTITHIPTLTNVVPIWYDYNLTPVDTGYTHITELLYANGTRGMSYLALKPTEIQVGLGTSLNGNTAFPSPYQSSNKYVKQQYLYSAADMIAMGAERGNITGLSFYFDTMMGSTTSINYLDYTISLGLTSDTIFTGTTATSWMDAPTTVYTRDTLTLHQTDDHAWVNHTFDTPFLWDGTSTVVVQITYNLTTKVTTGIKTRYTAKNNTTLHKAQDNPITATTASLAKGGNRPNVKFAMQKYGCSGPITTFDVTLTHMPQYDANLSWADGHDTLVYNSCDTISLPIVVRNLGSDNIDTMVLRYYLDALPVDSTVFADTTLLANHTYNLSFLGRQLSPGRHSVTAIACVVGDTIPSNDTIRTVFTVRFCGGNYTIAANDVTADYQSFGAAVDTLNQVGVVGPVTFQVFPGTYTEQVVLNNVNGSSAVNTISFVGQSDSVLLTASTSQAANYVMKIDGASNVNIDNLMIVARPTANNVNYAHALVMLNDSNINVTNCHIKVKGTITNANASCIVLQGNVANLTISGTVTDSGYYAIKTAGAEAGYSNFHIHDNIFREFASGGINIRGINRVILTHNELRSGNSTNSRGLIGIYMAATTDSMVIQKNAIYLLDERNGAKRGIQLEHVTGTMAVPAVLVNNMISTYGNGSAGLTPAKSAGIWIDSLSTYINVFYNTVRVRGSNVTANSSEGQLNSANNLTYAFWCGTSPTNISVMNNILSNFGYGYAYYLSQVNTVTTSNFNAFYTYATNKFALGDSTNITTLADWQVQSSTDGNSVFEEPFFVANDNLHMRMTNFAAKAQYNTEVLDDIDGTTRLPIPGPTIGAHESIRQNHDMAVVRIIKPVMPETLANPNNVETDSVRVVVTFHNNGLSNESGVYWYAYIEGYETVCRSVNRSLGTFVPAQLKTDSVMVPTFLGIIDTHYIHVVVVSNNDQVPDNDELREPFYLAPAFNLSALKVTATNAYEPAGCRMQQTLISINVKNAGSKDFPAGTTFQIGYHTEIFNPSTLTVTTLPDTVRENVTLTNPLPIGSDIWFDFDSLANLYPTGHYTNIKVRVKGWINYLYDIVQANDSTPLNNTASPIYDSYYTPAPPNGHDTTLAYGTWGEVTAEQINTRAIRWHRDSAAAPYYSPTQYNASKKWSNTPQYFHDSTYYLNALSDKGCPSYYSPVTVHVMPHKTRDVAVEYMLAPLGGRVYMENDTVRVQIANYGTTAQGNFPITYQLKRGNNIIQTVTDTVWETLAPDQTYAYTFDTLLNIPTPLTAQSYSLNVWTDLTNDATRRNDTLRFPHVFASLAQDVYNTPSSFPSAENTHFDITRVAFNGIDLDIPPLNRTYTDMAEYPNPDYPVLHVTRGTSDSIIIKLTQLDVTEQHFRCRGTVHIDYNRDGVFDMGGSCNEQVLGPVTFYSDSVLASVITIPNCASLGYMRMRVSVKGYQDDSPEGHVIDFLLFVDEHTPTADLAITQIVTPRDYIIRDDAPRVIKFRMANRGSAPINSVDINYSFANGIVGPTVTGVVPWTGTLDPGRSTVVALPEHIFPEGTTTLSLWHNMEGDADSTNNNLVHEYHRFLVTRPILDDNFDITDDWYAPTGYNNYTRNYWQRGMPHKARLDSTYTGDNAWVTDLGSPIVSGKRGNVSYLYSPIINMSAVKVDTVAFRLKRNLTGGSMMYVEFYNFERKWVKLYHDSCTTWYTDMENSVFSGTSGNSEGYGYYCISVSKMRLTNELNENTQFRIVYSTPVGSSTTSSFGEGCAVDNFYIGRGRRPIDASVIAFTKPVEPKYGQTIYPEVVVKNYGYDTIESLRIGYIYHGHFLARYTDVNCTIPPLGVDTFMCSTPFIITSDFPEEFHITAFTTRSDDIYRDNDTLMQMFTLSPLDKDIMAEEILTPLNHVVAGDTAVRVTLRMRNFGTDPIPTATASYIVNGITRVDETIDFEEMLGRPLQSLEYFNYTFQHCITAPMGLINLTAIIKSPVNNYIYNDTVHKRVEGIMSVTDLAASSIIVDTSSHEETRIVLVIDNVGARGANNFQVGYWIDNDTTTMVRETYYRALPLAALNTGYYTFSTTLPYRSSGYRIVDAFVHVEGDNDPSNDTTNVFATLFMDVAVNKVQIEENANNDCRVFLEVANVGNVSIVGRELGLRAAINGDSIKTNLRRNINPGEVIHLEFNRRIPKSPTRHYVGSGWINHVDGDDNATNDQTSLVEVINYFEGAPTVNGDNLVLEQNYPNPFTQQTTIPFTLPNAATVRFFVMDAMGHIVQRLERFCQAGPQTITIDMDAFAAGVYYYGIEVNGQRQMRKMILR